VASASADTQVVATTAPSTVTVSAEGDIPVVPNLLTATMGVSVGRPSVREALDAAGKEIADMITSVQGQGVTAAEIQSQSISVGQSTNQGGVVTGYTASAWISFPIHRVGDARAVIDAAASSAGNDVQFGPMTYSVVPDDATLLSARKAAMTAARTKAEQWARLAGRHVGTIRSVSEGNAGATFSAAPGPGGAGGAGYGGASSIPLQPGLGQVSIQVSVVFDLVD
jgi:uncharacterized protein YggE